MPVSISIGLWTTLLTYLISIPLGIRKAVRDGSKFDVWTSGAIIIGYSIPSFLFATLLIVVFAGGKYFDWFPLRGLVSDNWHDLDWPHRILDYFWHITLPILAMVISGFASMTILTKNSFLEEINKQYVLTARAKGAGEGRVLYGHVFRNAMLIVIASLPDVASTPARLPSPTMAIDFVIVTAPYPAESFTSISPFAFVTSWAYCSVRHGFAIGPQPAWSTPVPEIHVRAFCACAVPTTVKERTAPTSAGKTMLCTKSPGPPKRRRTKEPRS